MIISSNLENFSFVDNEVLEDKNLSAKAKGIWAFLMTKPDGWEVSIKELTEQLPEGKDSIRTALNELEDAGLLDRGRS